jgi:hypothetical protein
MINRYWQIARTYYRRPRFWVFGGIYLGSMLWWTSHSVEPSLQAMASTALACVMAAFIALHLRRQFSGAAARMLPDFAGPHLVVGAFMSLLTWVAVPWLEAAMAGLPPLGLIAIHSVAGMFLALVVCWRQAIFVLAALPLLALAAVNRFLFQHSMADWYERLVHAGEPLPSLALIGSAVLAQVVAALVLLRLSDLDAPLNDDFLADVPRTDGFTGQISELLLKLSDRRLRRRLADAGYWGWSIERWRLPVAVSGAHFALAVLATMLLMTVAWYVSGQPEGIAIGSILAVPLMLMAPFSLWHQRRRALSVEFMRPVARAQFFQQLAVALAVDVVLWTALASVLNTVGYAMIDYRGTPHVQIYRFIACQFCIVWAIAVWLYGVGLATFRFRYWIPMMVGFALAWCFVIVPIVAAYEANGKHHTGTVPILPVLVFCLLTAGFGVLMASIAYRWWVASDLI